MEIVSEAPGDPADPDADVAPPEDDGGEMLPRPDNPNAAERLREIAMSPEHQLTHLPKNPYCEVCRRAKLCNAQHRRKVNRAKASSSLPKPPKRFGAHLVADHIVAHSERSRGFTGDGNALVLRDVLTGYIGCYPMKSRTGWETVRRLSEFIGPCLRIDMGVGVLMGCASEIFWG